MVLNSGMFGVLCVQVYLYYIKYSKDRRQIKFLVYVLFIWETAQTGLLTSDSFELLAAGWGDLSKLDYIGFMWFSGPFMMGIMGTTVQSVFAWRIYVLGRSRFLCAFIVSLALMEGAAAMAQGLIVRLQFEDHAVGMQHKMFSVTAVWLVGSACCDMIICASMIYLLKRAQRRTVFRATEDMLTRLLHLSVGTGMLTSSVAAVCAILFLASQTNNFYMAPMAVLGKLYSNSLMVLFNARLRTASPGKSDSATYIWESEFDPTSEGHIEFRRHLAPGTRRHPNDVITDV
ncbi:hypothetical protein EW146_g6253 [Bondarzewia mesenterica]|uniref:DUF6534 domain-containing protein n=1 Tax=Bondarzewia mesenterica TaxID=1095465 RepID=A0A4S4LUV0_9AGAM|nr:hypothetical protein EW146_g6253 [Bondarzewia mesenterica]